MIEVEPLAVDEEVGVAVAGVVGDTVLVEGVVGGTVLEKGVSASTAGVVVVGVQD